jgi:hypothetical protein
MRRDEVADRVQIAVFFPPPLLFFSSLLLISAMPPRTRLASSRSSTKLVTLGKFSVKKHNGKMAALRKAPKAKVAAAAAATAASLSTYGITAHVLDKPGQQRNFVFRVLFASAATRTHANHDTDEAFLEPIAAAIDAAFPGVYDVQEESIVELSHHEAHDATTRIHVMLDGKHQSVASLRESPALAVVAWSRQDAASAFAPGESPEDDTAAKAAEAAAAPNEISEDASDGDNTSDSDDDDDGDEDDQAMDAAEEEHVPSDDSDEDDDA